MTSPPLLSVRHLRKVYNNGVTALRDISLDVQRGEFVAIVGLSGAGKSTLLRCLNRLVEPTSGEIHFQGQRVDHLPRSQVLHLRRKMAMIFQQFNLIPRHSVLDNVLMGCLSTTSTWRSCLGMFPQQDREWAASRLELVGLRDKLSMRADQLSGGQQQRVAIARALAQQPELLLADEPVASLDPSSSHTIMRELRQIHRDLGLTVICNLHFLSLVREYATRVLALRDGAIVFDGRPDQIDDRWFKNIYGEDAREVQIK